jgi:hypothetical protein
MGGGSLGGFIALGGLVVIFFYVFLLMQADGLKFIGFGAAALREVAHRGGDRVTMLA